MRGLHWFQYDLRLHDNPALSTLAARCDSLVCVYVLDSRWFGFGRYQSRAMGGARWQFIRQSLNDLQRSLQALGHQLFIVPGEAEKLIPALVEELNIDMVGYTRHPGHYEQEIFAAAQSRCPAAVTWRIEEAFTLYEQDQLPFEPYKLPKSFTPFRKKVEDKVACLKPVAAPGQLPAPLAISDRWQKLSGNLPEEPAWQHQHPSGTDDMAFAGGEKAGLLQLRYYLHDSKRVSEYKETRNGLDGWDFSSKLSPWLAQGCLSARQVVAELDDYEHRFGGNESTYWLFFELLWREYFQWVAYKFDRRLFSLRGIRDVNPLQTFYPEPFTAWKFGTTKSPFVNAFMRQLMHTGWMSNRGRQIVASYLVNELRVDWRYGAAWFEERLIDYDVASNWGNWQYLGGVGNDPRGQRRLNIEKQAEHYDPNGEFTERWATFAPEED